MLDSSKFLPMTNSAAEQLSNNAYALARSKMNSTHGVYNFLGQFGVDWVIIARYLVWQPIFCFSWGVWQLGR
jgi:hypothetical protein